MSKKIPQDILQILQAVTAKRVKTVIDHILEHGHITTEELKERYGYNHPPRAARDVRELGIPLKTFTIKDSTGRAIGAYRFGKWEDFRVDKFQGRHAFSKQFKKDLVAKYGELCLVCSGVFEERYLQIDHRIPYQVAGDDPKSSRDLDHYMLVCSSCNRAKSWSCEHCANWHTKHNPTMCADCYWASPLDYKHIAMSDIRRLAMVWQGEEVSQYDHARKMANIGNEDMPTFVKKLINKLLKR
jgi:hypothetical protein